MQITNLLNKQTEKIIAFQLFINLNRDLKFELIKQNS